MTEHAKNSEFETTTVRLGIGMIAKMKETAKNSGLSQSSFIRFAIYTTINRFERGEIS